MTKSQVQSGTENVTVNKSSIALYHWMDGRGYFTGCSAMKMGQKHHTGKRRGGEAEFSHQIWIANTLRTLPIPSDSMERCLVLAFLHDVCEDKHVHFDSIRVQFGDMAERDVRLISKEYAITGEKKSPDAYYKSLTEEWVVALVKGVDRLHNLNTMVNAFSFEKQVAYIKETHVIHLPMLKEMRQRYPMYSPCFENVKRSIQNTITLVESMHEQYREKA